MSPCWLYLLWLCLFLNSGKVLAADSARNQATNLIRRADALKTQQEYQAALPLYKQAIKLQPQNAEALAGLAWVTFSLGDKQNGLKQARQATRLDPKNPVARHHLGVMYWMLNQPQKAAAEFRAEFAIDPKRNCHCGPMESLLSAYPEVKHSHR